jgi:spermidine/putrescine transport system permease protein
VRARLEGMDPHIEEAARDLGAGEMTTFWKVTLPMIAPGVAAAAVLAFALSVDDYVITSFNAGQTQTFPLFIFGATRQGVPAEVNVLATMLLIAVLLLMGLNVLLQRRLSRRDASGGGAEAVGAEEPRPVVVTPAPSAAG